MRAAALQQNLLLRLRQTPTWVGILGYGTFFGLFPLMFSGWKAFNIPTLVTAYGLSFCYGLLSPLPWLWTGDDRSWAGHFRGALQALLFSVLLVGLCGIPLLLAQGLEHLRPLLPYLPLHILGLILVGYFIALGIRTECQQMESREEARAARFQLLQAQLSPHFLFNALSAFAELGRRDWPATEQGLLDLARVYRGLLELGERPEAPLGEERALLEAMLSVEALRFGSRLQVDWNWDETLDAQTLPPLLLLPLVENALKHGLAPHPDGGRLHLVAQRSGEGLCFEVANTGSWGAPALGTGTGLRNLKARLHLAYGSAASFQLTREADWTRARILLPATFDAS